MPQSRNTDNAANSVIWAVSQLNQKISVANRNALYQNTSANATLKNVTVGMYGADAAEVTATGGIPHTGWVLRTAFTGGRAGRVQHEVLVAGSMLTDAVADNPVLPQFSLSFLTQPQANAGSFVGNAIVTFNGVAASAPAGLTPTYLWQYSSNNGSAWATTVAVGGFSNQTTNTLSVNANTVANNVLVRLIASGSGAVNATSQSAKLTVTA